MLSLALTCDHTHAKPCVCAHTHSHVESCSCDHTHAKSCSCAPHSCWSLCFCPTLSVWCVSVCVCTWVSLCVSARVLEWYVSVWRVCISFVSMWCVGPCILLCCCIRIQVYCILSTYCTCWLTGRWLRLHICLGSRVWSHYLVVITQSEWNVWNKYHLSLQIVSHDHSHHLLISLHIHHILAIQRYAGTKS